MCQSELGSKSAQNLKNLMANAGHCQLKSCLEKVNIPAY